MTTPENRGKTRQPAIALSTVIAATNQ